MVKELQPGKFGEERQQMFKSIVDFFEQVGKEWYCDNNLLPNLWTVASWGWTRRNLILNLNLNLTLTVTQTLTQSQP